MKSIIAAGLLLGCAHGAIAGPYANVETNTSYFGDDYLGAVTEVTLGTKVSWVKTAPGMCRQVLLSCLWMVKTWRLSSLVRSAWLRHL